VNVLPRDAGDYARGKALYQRWAAEVTRMGGAVSAEHGVGKLKRGFLATMYGDEAIRQMARLKLQLDPAGVLGRGNLVNPALLDALIAENPAQAQEA
jgi:D-lactate dehydrogenase (cytochrome)